MPGKITFSQIGVSGYLKDRLASIENGLSEFELPFHPDYREEKEELELRREVLLSVYTDIFGTPPGNTTGGADDVTA